MNTPLRFIACTLTLAAGCAEGQPDTLGSPPPWGELTALADTRMLIGDDDTIAFAAGELVRERLVKGAPYCADAQQESVQPLADGNRIVNRHSTRLCRDGEGRTRQEVDRAGRRLVYLRDPVSRESWVLDPQRKTARRLATALDTHGAVDTSAWREYAAKMREWAHASSDRTRRDAGLPATPPAAPAPPAPPSPPARPAPPAPVVLSHEARSPDDPHPHGPQVLVLRMEGIDGPLPQVPPVPGVPALPPMMAPLPPPGVVLRAQLGAPRGPGAVSSLGTKELDGLKASGERTTWTIEAGKVGNEKPIVIVREVWTSPDLMLTLQSRLVDPRVGETTYRLANLKRGEPDAALMRVPADYLTTRSAPMPMPIPAPKPPSGPPPKG